MQHATIPPETGKRSRQAAGFRNATLRRVLQRKRRAEDRPKQLQSERLHRVFKCDMRAADYALKAAALLVVSGALAGGAFSVLKSANSIWHIVWPMAGFVSSIALLWAAFKLMCAFTFSMAKPGMFRGTTQMVQLVVSALVASLLGAVFGLVVTIWQAGL